MSQLENLHHVGEQKYIESISNVFHLDSELLFFLLKIFPILALLSSWGKAGSFLHATPLSDKGRYAPCEGRTLQMRLQLNPHAPLLTPFYLYSQAPSCMQHLSQGTII